MEKVRLLSEALMVSKCAARPHEAHMPDSRM